MTQRTVALGPALLGRPGSALGHTIDPATRTRVGVLGLQRLGIVEHGERSVRGYFRHRMTTYAAALAYRALFGLFPFVLPFIAATVVVAALPLLLFLLFYGRAQRLMPKVRDWMNNSWLVNIIVCVVFIVLIL